MLAMDVSATILRAGRSLPERNSLGKFRCRGVCQPAITFSKSPHKESAMLKPRTLSDARAPNFAFGSPEFSDASEMSTSDCNALESAAMSRDVKSCAIAGLLRCYGLHC